MAEKKGQFVSLLQEVQKHETLGELFPSTMSLEGFSWGLN